MSYPKPKSFGNWILFGFSAQHAVVSWFLGLLSIVTFFAHKPRFEGALILTVRLRDWFSKTLKRDADGSVDKGFSRYSSTLFRTIFWNEGRDIPRTVAEELDTRHERHEREHIYQFEDECMRGFFLGFFLATLMWLFGWGAWRALAVWEIIWLLMPIMLTTNWFTAFLRYGPAAKVRPNGTKRSLFARVYDTAYLESAHERTARAVTEGRVGDKIWMDREAERR